MIEWLTVGSPIPQIFIFITPPISKWVSGPFPLRPGMVVQICNPNSWEADAVRLGIQGCSQLHSKHEAGLGYKRPCLKRTITIVSPPLKAG